jgi:Zn-dependent oligopeptidase
LRQLYFGLFDLKVHTAQEQIDYTRLWNDSREEVRRYLDIFVQ